MTKEIVKKLPLNDHLPLWQFTQFLDEIYSQVILLTSILKIIYLTKGVGIQAIKSCETSYL